MQSDSELQQNTVQNKWDVPVKYTAYFIGTTSLFNLILAVIGFFLDHHSFMIPYFDLLNLAAAFALTQYSRFARIYLLCYLWFSLIAGIPVFSTVIIGSDLTFFPRLQQIILIILRFCCIPCLVILHYPHTKKLFREMKKKKDAAP